MQKQLELILSKMTLEEKASLCSGYNFWETKSIRRLGIPSIYVADGPHGLRKENEDDDNVGLKASFPATSFPPAVNLASTWNVDLAYKMGDSLSKQCKDQGVTTILGPGTNIKRNPLCGRNFEYFSEDPYLAGEFCVSYINGVQDNGVGTSLKHYAANSQEYLRFTIDSIIDERSLRELYLPSFEVAVKEAQPWTVMHSYNRLNGVHLSDNEKLLKDILRKEWGFKGIVVTDWNAMNNRIKALKAGTDLEMPSTGGRTDREIVTAIKAGELDESILDEAVLRLLEYVFKCQNSADEDYTADYDAAHKIAREIATESIILMKNDKKLLPMAKGEEYAVIGRLAKECRYQGSGSSRINPYSLVNFTDNLDNLGVKYSYAEGYTLSEDGFDQNLINQAVEMAKNNKNVILFIGLTENFENEGIDRSSLKLPSSHDILCEKVLEVNPNAIIVLSGGAVVELPWADKASTLLNTYLAGEACGEAIYDIIFGDAVPSGKLAETYPIKYEDYIGSKYYRGGPRTVEHREGIFIGYRYYDTAKKAVAFPFGHGLSYTEFTYSDLKISADSITDKDTLTVSLTVKNTGEYDGAEVVQLYVKDIESSIFKAEKELKGFEKVFLKKGESATVEFSLDKRSFAYYNTDIANWHVESGEYEILIGSSCRDIRLSDKVVVSSSLKDIVAQNFRETCPVYYNLEKADEIPSGDFEKLIGRKLPDNSPLKRGQFDRNTTIDELRCCIAGKIVYKVAPSFILGQMPNADFTTLLLMKKVFNEMPLRALNGITSGLLDIHLVDGLLMWGNKHRLKGLGMILKGLFISLGNIVKQNQTRQSNQEKRQTREAQRKQLKELRSGDKTKEEIALLKLELKSKKGDINIFESLDEETKLSIRSLKDEIKAKQLMAKENRKLAIKEVKADTKAVIKDINEEVKASKKQEKVEKKTDK